MSTYVGGCVQEHVRFATEPHAYGVRIVSLFKIQRNDKVLFTAQTLRVIAAQKELTYSAIKGKALR